MIASSKVLLDQLADLLDKISPQDYTRSLEILHGASIGEHVRHTLEFYLCLIEQTPAGHINYDLRKRDSSLESMPDAACRSIEFITSSLSEGDENTSLILEFSYDPEGLETRCIPTNFFRELTYVIEHTVHHMALLKIGLQALSTPLMVPPSFGVAVSTLRYRNSLKHG